MKFTKTIMSHQECYISGIYKCVNYDGWRAYFKPSGWSNWGMACERTNIGNSVKYSTLEQAQDACKRHHKQFGNHPGQFDRFAGIREA